MTIATVAPDDEISSTLWNTMAEAVNAFEALLGGTYGSLLTLSNGLTSSNNSATVWAGRFKNANAANGLGLLVEDPAGGLDVFKVRRSAAGRNIVVSNQQDASLPTESFWLIADTPSASGVGITLDVIANSVGTGKDQAAVRGIFDQRDSGGNNAGRGLEGRVRRVAPAAAAATWGAELSVVANVASGDGISYYVGLYIDSGATPALSGQVATDSGIYMGGPAGYNNYLYCVNTSGALRFRVAGGLLAGDNAGDVMSAGNLYSQLASGGIATTNRIGVINHTGAGSGDTYAGLSYDNSSNVNALILGALTGGVGYRNILLAPNAGSIGVNVSTAELAAGVGGASAGALPTALFVDGTIGLASSLVALKTTIVTPNANYSALGAKTDEFWYRKTSGGAEVKMVDASQIITLEAAGVTSGPTTTSSSYADLTDMTLTFTSCTAGDKLEVEFTGAFTHSVTGGAVVVALKHDANAETRAFSINEPTAGYPFLVTTHGIFTATAGTNVIKARWLTGSGTATANGTDRYMKGRRTPV